MNIIYISGIDGCGKTTQSTLLVEALQGKGINAEYQWLRWEPSIVPVLKKLRSLAGKPRTESGEAQKNEALRKSENRSHSRWSRIKASLMKNALFRKIWFKYACSDYYASYRKASTNWAGDYIVMDRYLMDFVVDQSLNFSVGALDFLSKLDESALGAMTKPAYSIFIDLPANVGYERKLDGTSLKYLQDRESIYKSIPSNDATMHIDGTLPPETIHQEIKKWLSERIGVTL